MAQLPRLHVLGIPHLASISKYNACAFNEKTRKFIRMMSEFSDYEIIYYGHELRDWDYARVEHVAVSNDAILRQAYGTEYVDQEAWRTLGFGHYFSITDPAYQHFHAETIKAIAKRKQPNDILCVTFGYGHRAISDAHPDMITVETGIGYPSAFAPFRVYESHAIRNAMNGPESIGQCNQNAYHVVIPNFFEAEDFEYSDTKQDYLLFLGRVGTNKGIDIAIEVARHTGRRLKIAGQGTLKSLGYTDLPANIEEVGYADQSLRRQLMRDASALIIGSKYTEPFAGVQVEAWMSGTPVISPDYAAFAELNQQGVTGFRCRTLRDYVQAVNNLDQISHLACRQHAEKFTLSSIAPEYIRYFQDVLEVYTGLGWYSLGPR